MVTVLTRCRSVVSPAAQARPIRVSDFDGRPAWTFRHRSLPPASKFDNLDDDRLPALTTAGVVDSRHPTAIGGQRVG